MTTMTKEEVVINDPEIAKVLKQSSLDIKDIEKIIPHRYPFVMVDRVTNVVPGKSATGFKNVTAGEFYFQGHFPNIPIMPGVLQVEALAQLSCITMTMLPEYAEKYIGLFTGIESMKFKKMVLPGDKLDLEATLNKFRFPFGKFDVKATVNGELCAQGTISFALADKDVLKNEKRI